ncbi:hypothetical protein OV450_2806, partial [Actinobacteria bacterium OV450]
AFAAGEHGQGLGALCDEVVVGAVAFGPAVHEDAFAGVRLASLGPFLPFSGPDEAVRRVAEVSATLAVSDLAAAVEEGIAAGATVVMPAQPTPNGHRAVLRHPHGGVYEYVGP